jgi:hypothetical protein
VRVNAARTDDGESEDHGGESEDVEDGQIVEVCSGSARSAAARKS